MVCKVVFGAVLALLVAVSCLVFEAQAAYIDVDVSQAKQMIESNPNFVILDVRTQEEYDSGHIQNATHIPVGQLQQRIGELDKQRPTLVYCRLGGRSVTASETLVNNGFSQVYNMLGGITAWMNAGYWIEIVHNGDLVLSGTQTLAIENCTYIQTGNIFVRDSSELMLRNTMLVLNQTRGPEFEARVDGQAAMDMENAHITSQFWYAIGVGGNAKANVINSTTSYMTIFGYESGQIQITKSTVGEISPMGSSNLTLVDSVFVEGVAISFLFGPPNNLHLSGLEPRYYEYWNLHENQTVSNVPFDLTLRNVTVQSWNLEFVHDVQASVSDSRINAIFLHFYNTTTEIRDIQAPFYGDLTFEQIRIKNTSVQTWALRLENTLASIANSTVDLTCVGNSDISAVDTIVTLRYWLFNGRISFNRTTCYGIFDTTNSSVYMQGDMKSMLNGIGWWISSNVVRNYHVVAQDANGKTLDNVGLTLFDKNNKAVWTGSTDGLGEAGFNITFTDSNYATTLRLEAVKGNLSSSENIAFLDGTPVIVQLATRLLGDLNGDWVVDIYDAIMLANAFNSRIGDLNWNSNADINGDNVVDIYDAIILAGSYGKKA